MLYKRPAFRWVLNTPSLSYYGTPQQVRHIFQRLEEAGVQITNIKELEKELQHVRTMKLRKDDGTLMSAKDSE